MSPDTVSTLFPDRPIRPLPKRRLRERLSPEVAETIKYPPSTIDAVPLFRYPPYSLKDSDLTPRLGAISPTESGYSLESTRNYSARQPGDASAARAGAARENGRQSMTTRPLNDTMHRNGNRGAGSDAARRSEHQPTPSATSSFDGYDSFENTNNKKKRKIPSAGDPALSSAYSLNVDAGLYSLASGAPPTAGLSGSKPYADGHSQVSPESLAAGSPGFSGSGRGRLGRSLNGRIPLRTLSDGNNTWSGRPTKDTGAQWASSDHGGSGIISSAIANAGKLPPLGQENVSLLQQHSSASKGASASTQFTFTCDSQVPGTLQWPGNAPRNGMSGYGSGTYSHGNPLGAHDVDSKSASRSSGKSRRESRRRLEKELAMAAQHRQQMAAERYFNNPPKLDDIWICEFCEYERIFGEPPRALIREYELKDRRARQEEADRKRLLEKARAKGRKAKKNMKGASKANNAATPHDEYQHSDEQLRSPEHQGNGHSTQSEEEEDDDYLGEYDDEQPNSVPPTPQLNRSLRADEGGGRPLPYRTLPPQECSR